MKNLRINFIFVVFLLISATITGRLVFIQIRDGDFYRALSQGLHISFAEEGSERGEIFLRDGKSLAINMEWFLVFAQPKEITDLNDAAEKLSPALGLDKNFLLERMGQNNFYALLKRKLTEEEVAKVRELDIDGIYLAQEEGRYYPQEELASQIIGFMGAEQKGQYGLEEFYNETLEGEPSLTEQTKGSDLTLTLDYDIQFKAEQMLKEAAENLAIEGGQIIVVEPNSGEILAMANLENFNPNNYEEYAKEGNLEIFRNPSTQNLFEPGSVFKPITMAAALEENRITPDTTYFDEGSVTVSGETIYNYGQRSYGGPLTMTNVLEKSINTGAVFVEKRLGPSSFMKYIEKFGFFEPSGIDIQETYSSNKELKNGREVNFATASFGQGIEMTPVQLIRAYSAIANGGKLITPYLVQKVSSQDNLIGNEQIARGERIISPKTASDLTAMLISVVKNGYAKAAGVPGYFVAGKTGTAQVSYGALGIAKEGYSEKTVQSFVGFAPAFNPRFLIMVKLDNPNTNTAEYSAVPIFKQMADFIIHLYEIPPDYQE